MWELSNRELAVLFWLGALILFGFSKADVRAAGVKLIAAFLQPKVFSVFAAFALYIAASVWIMARLDLWNVSLLKDTLIWCVISGIALLFSAIDAPKNPNFFRTVLVELFSISAFLTFFYELQSFPFAVEFFLQPLVAILVLMIAISQTDSKYKQVQSCLNYSLAIMAAIVFFFTAWYLFRNSEEIEPLEVLNTFMLPVLLTIVALPYVFVFAVFVFYEVILTRMEFQNRRQPVSWPVRLALLLTFKGNIFALNSIDIPCSVQIARSGTFKEARNAALKCRGK